MLDTRFRLGSMNKMLTSVAILERAGKVSLDGTLGDYLTAYGPDGQEVKLPVEKSLIAKRGGRGKKIVDSLIQIDRDEKAGQA